MDKAPDKLSFRPARVEDAGLLYALVRANGGNERLEPAFLQHWYFNNPSHSFSIETVWLDGRPEGMATSNNFRFRINGRERLVAMPQNVLTSDAVRGKGLFGKLYFRTEAANRAAGADTFLTFTNELSTPIFLQKFGYRRGRCPDVLLHPFHPLALLSSYRFRTLAGPEALPLSTLHRPENALLKDAAWYGWRYAAYAPGVIRFVEVSKGGRVLGALVLKKEKKKGLPFFLLMDAVAPDEATFAEVLRAAPVAATRAGAPFLLMYDAGFAPPRGPYKRIRNRFNFLVKGTDAADTEALAETDFRLFFGDMDIV
ncbi:hypothetical protein [Flaviaesturariibacter aridisoli]|uniref:GNAT family N-acetyltransferase n=1 Tax=Flaviaesturariibacter aridisoli TaxID=2545761 RepID=A0A4R4E2U4_9BACT|nr:hypothetical protein [Flaviaesturariibacter aridisoli]TCZ73113.1 hypothetical protein E0486_07105 [Flaviaesturariibacter aridisoli]